MNEATSTLGAVYQKLLDNGYAPASPLLPANADPHLFEIAEHPPGVLTWPYKSQCGEDYEARRVAALVISGTLDKAARAKVDTILERRGLAGGPLRIDSAGNAMRVLAVRKYQNIFSRRTQWGPKSAIALHAITKPNGFLTGAVLPLDGTWKNGDLLRVAHAQLPVIDDDAVAPLFAELDDALFVPEPYTPRPIDPNPPPSMADLNRPNFVGPKSKRDLIGQESLAAAGWGEGLPDNPPEEKREIRGGAVTQDRLERIAAARLQSFLAGQSH